MKLDSAVHQEEPVLSEEQLLQVENEFLRDELEIQKIEHSLEIYEAIFDCVEKTGEVSKSLEIMFGENVSSSETMLTELHDQYKAATEGLFKFIADRVDDVKEGAIFAAQAKRAKALSERVKKVMDKVEVPISKEYTGISAMLRTIVLMIQHGTAHYNEKFNSTADAKSIANIQHGLGASIIKSLKLSDAIRTTEGIPKIYIETKPDLAKELESLAHHSRLSVDTDVIKRLIKEINENVGVDAKYWANYDDKKIKRLKFVLLRGVAKTNMQILDAIEAAIRKAENE